MARVIVGVDPDKLSTPIEVVDKRETVLAAGRFGTDKAGYAAMRKLRVRLAGADIGRTRQHGRRTPSCTAAPG